MNLIENLYIERGLGNIRNLHLVQTHTHTYIYIQEKAFHVEYNIYTKDIVNIILLRVKVTLINKGENDN